MKKKLIFGLIAVVAVVGTVVGMSAYEAHVINVTAHIENALSVDTTPIEFGTVFPQEYLERQFTINLSDSFMTAVRVDDVEYKIVQKPKCKSDTITEPGDPDMYAPVDYATHQCPEGYTEMLSLCPFLSKLPVEEAGDIGELSYYDSDNDTCPERQLVGASGVLSKEAQDISDIWTVDLKVPPVRGFIGQDWPEGCPVVDANDQDYGCDLWIEVTNISLPTNGICEEKPDVMQVLDESSSIDASELVVLKTAAKAFITALAPTEFGAHMGQTSFETTGSLDHVLSYNVATLNAAVDALGSDGYTNLKEGIELASAELAGANDRLDSESPDFMVIITDGFPNRPIGTPEQDAIDAANAADAAGTTIYVVGVGTTPATSVWLRDNIATSPAHYFDATDWTQLQAILEALASCNG